MRAARPSGADSGATAVEYALIVAAIAAVIVVMVYIFGKTVLHQYSNSCAAVNTNGSQRVATGTCS